MKLPPDEGLADIKARIPGIVRHVVGIFGLAEDGRVAAKGTGTLVRVGSEKFAFTAEHVVRGTVCAGLRTILTLFPLTPDGTAVIGTFTPPQQIPLHPSSVFWTNQSLDAAAISTSALDLLPDGMFIDGEPHANTTRRETKEEWQELSTEQEFVPFSVHGFANIGGAVDSELRVQVLSCFSFILEVSSWDDAHWFPGIGTSPQCYFDLSSVDLPVDVSGENAWEQHLEKAVRVSDSEINNEAFGGISGGPIFRLAGNGHFLSAVVKQGGRIFGVPRIVASSWDDIFFAFAHEVPDVNLSAS